MKDFVYKLRLIDWHTKESLGIPEESNGIITILMQPGSTVHNLKEKVMQWLGALGVAWRWRARENGWNSLESRTKGESATLESNDL